jgi:hypothetical protein
MDDYARSRGQSFGARREATWIAIVEYRCLAPARIAMDETRERVLTEAAQTRLLSPATSAQRRPVSNLGHGDFKEWIARCGRWLERRFGVRALPNRLGNSESA